MCGRVKGQGREKVRQGDEVAIVVDFTVLSRAKRGRLDMFQKLWGFL